MSGEFQDPQLVESLVLPMIGLSTFKDNLINLFKRFRDRKTEQDPICWFIPKVLSGPGLLAKDTIPISYMIGRDTA